MALHTRGRDSKALAFAALITLILGFVPEQPAAPEPGSFVSMALDGLLDAKAAQTEGAWWLEEPTATARLSFAPEHGLVWRVGNDGHEVLLDATTGEALAFEFE